MKSILRIQIISFFFVYFKLNPRDMYLIYDYYKLFNTHKDTVTLVYYFSHIR